MEVVKEKKSDAKVAALVEKLKESSVPLKYVSFHAGTGFPGAVADATTFSPDKQPGIKISFHPPSSLVLVEMKGRFFVTHATSAKGMEFDLTK